MTYGDLIFGILIYLLSTIAGVSLLKGFDVKWIEENRVILFYAKAALVGALLFSMLAMMVIMIIMVKDLPV